MVYAVISKDLKREPLPTGQPLELIPKCLPSHPKGHSKLVFREPWCRKLADPAHPSEQGLPWKLSTLHKLPEPEEDKTAWGWPRFYSPLSKDNADILSLLFHPCADLKEFVNSRRTWHDQQVSKRGPLVNTLLVIEEHSFYILPLKLVITKGDANRISPDQHHEAIELLKKYGPLLLHAADKALGSLKLPVEMRQEVQSYTQAVYEYAKAVDKLSTPVNLWLLPVPPGCVQFGATKVNAALSQ